MEPFFFSSSINWIPSRYQASASSFEFVHHILKSSLQENAIPQKGDRAYINLICKKWHYTEYTTIDITVTLTFIRIMHDIPPINSSNETTLVDTPKGIISHLKSALSVFSWLSYFANQIEDIGSIDTLAPVHLHSSTTRGSNFIIGQPS